MHIAIAALNDIDTSNLTWGLSVQLLRNKVDIATYFATTKLNALSDLESLRAVIADVTADPNSVSGQMILCDAVSGGYSSDKSWPKALTTGQDFLTGSHEDDAFTAWIFNNQNTAQTGDSIDAGQGHDTLLAELGSSDTEALLLTTQSIETATFTAQVRYDQTSGELISDKVFIDAQQMEGTTEFWSTDSRGDLIIDNIQADSHEVTLGWRNADEDVDFKVSFSNVSEPYSILEPGSQLFLELLNMDGSRDGNQPLESNPFIGFNFTMGEVLIEVDTLGYIETNYEDLVTAINTSFVEQGLTTLTASLGYPFSYISSDHGLPFEGTTIIITNSGPETLTAGSWFIGGALPAGNLFESNIFESPSVKGYLWNSLEANVVFDNVGNGEKAGDFIISSPPESSIDSTVNDQRLNISVDNDSWLSSIYSEESTLEGLFIENLENGGSLRIEELNDIRIIDASDMANNLTFNLTLSEDTVTRYLDRENSTERDLIYLTGIGDDSLSINIDETVAEHSYFSMNISTGAGHDDITVSGQGAISINPGLGDDRIVLSTEPNSQSIIEFSWGNIGNNIIVNFDPLNAQGDKLDFTQSHLNSSFNLFGTTTRVKTTTNPITDLDNGNISLKANETVIFNGFRASKDETWAALDAEKLLEAINNSKVDGADNYGNIDTNDLNVTESTQTNFQSNLVMIENDNNDGEYKLFQLNTWDNSNQDFDEAILLGTIDFGESLTAGDIFI